MLAPFIYLFVGLFTLLFFEESKMNFRQILSALGEISTPKRRGEVLTIVENKMDSLRAKLARLEAEYEQMDNLFKLLEGMDKKYL